MFPNPVREHDASAVEMVAAIMLSVSTGAGATGAAGEGVGGRAGARKGC